MENKKQYVEALCNELFLQKEYLNGEEIYTIYFGGGTPSQLIPSDFEEIFTQIYRVMPFDKVREVTLEANPDDISPSYIQALRRLPFNRISLGIQSFDDTELRFLNRRHNAATAIRAVKDCQSYGFENISIDLMYGLPNQTLDGWKKNIRQAIDLNVQHISAYHLIYEEGTPLYNMLKGGKIVAVDEDLSILLFNEMIDRFAEAGFEQYEISNFAKEGFHSQHNSSYWDGTHYLGIGASAHSFNGKNRQWNIASIDKYIDSVSGGNLMPEIELMNEKTAYNDYILTRMRTSKGVNLNELTHMFGEKFKTYCLIQAQKHMQNNSIIHKENSLALTRKGIFISDGIMSDLMILPVE